ncbi:SH3 domain-containing protein [Tychonema sp. LEGE 06208]|uniref:SH3 domain-containing protein n=1 Tax=Tychonema sp. LEGE 06208 TaxID=1828663 RepID=UPI001880F4A2|nr:SH3 domain-containing protein [Tychonema sp. LEGE 06208]MBE9162074.1 SH3 domain-containing protein [Tychonema sp. LEGE 06208]
MEALALNHSFVAYESPESELQLELKVPTSALVGVAGMAVALSVMGVAGEAQAGCYKQRCGGGHGYNRYGEVATNGGRLNIRHRPNGCARVIGKLYNGDNVALTGRYRHGWAQLKGGGWVSTAWIN